jgi:hypothetical protein
MYTIKFVSSKIQQVVNIGATERVNSCVMLWKIAFLFTVMMKEGVNEAGCVIKKINGRWKLRVIWSPYSPTNGFISTVKFGI